MKPTHSEIEKLRERYLENKYPGDLSEILGPREDLDSSWQVRPNHENIPSHSSLIRWSLVATLFLGLTLGLIWALTSQKPVALKTISLPKKTNSKLQTPQRSSLWLSGHTKRIFQKDHVVKNAFLKTASTAQIQIRLTKSSPSPSVKNSRQLAKNFNQTKSPPSFWKTTPRQGSVFNLSHKKTGNGAKKNTRSKRSIFFHQRYKLSPTHPPRRS
jgi:hypothetical protein